MAPHDPVLPAATVGLKPILPIRDFYSAIQRFLSNYFLRAVAQAVVTVWAVITFTFFLVRLLPGSPVDVYVDFLMNQQNITYAEAFSQAASKFKFDPDASQVDQYFAYMGQLLRLDMGESITSTGTQVIEQIMRFLPWTLFSAGLGLLISFSLGIVLGMLMAHYRNSPLDHSLSIVSSIMSSVPNYIWGLMIVIVFAVQLKWFNVGDLRGTTSPGITPGFSLEFIADVLKHAFLPVLVYVIGTLGQWMLSMRNSTTSVLGEDYVSVAKARGLSQSRILLAYVGRNASLPLFTLLAISIGFVIGGSVIIENLFVYNGLGYFLFWSITQRDYTSMQGVFLFITISVIVSNLFADLLYSRLDPRIRITGEK